MTKPTLERLEDRLAPAVLHTAGEDFSLRGTTLYARSVTPFGAGFWAPALLGVRSAVVADQGQVVDVLLTTGQVISSIHTAGISTPWRLTLSGVSSLSAQNGVATATLNSGAARYNNYRLGAGTPWQASLSAPLQTWEVDWAGYSNAQKQYMLSAVHLALSGLPAGSSDFLEAAALTSFVHQWVHREADQDTQNGYGVLVSRHAVCGGMTVTLAEMLLAAGIPSQHFFELGGTNPAHSMLEAQFRDGTRGILDPYYGVVYYDLKLQRPVGVADLPRYLASGAPCSYLCKLGDYLGNPSRDPPVQPMQTFLGSYALTTYDAHNLYSYPAVFTHSAQRHLAYDGLPLTVSVPLTPDSLLGDSDWQPSARAPKPWSDLGGATLAGGESLSWAYVLGYSGGSLVQHDYQLSGLTAGKHYRLSLTVANAGTLPDFPSIPAITLQGLGEVQTVQLQRSFWLEGLPYQPQVETFDFTAPGPTATIHASALGVLVLAGIQLQRL